MTDGNDERAFGRQTKLVHTGRRPSEQFGFVNTPPFRGSTILYPDLESFETNALPYSYGRTGNPSSQGVQELITALEGAKGTVLTPSGLSAISTALISVAKAGGDVLITDSAYGPTRRFADTVLKRIGVEPRYFDPRIGSEIAQLVTDKTCGIFLESPGSLTFEIQDVPAISEVARRHNIPVLIDNSWATPLYLRPLDLGADIVVHAGTKMFVGHSDAMVGTISANERYWPQVNETHRALGIYLAPDEAFLTARGMRTLELRMKEHSSRSVEMANWLEGMGGVTRVLHPALPSHLDHALFSRDFKGSGSLFSIILEPRSRTALAAMVDHWSVFGMGASWGGYESLALPSWPEKVRTAVPWNEDGQMLRLHIGFEDMNDLKSDLAEGLARYLAAD